MVVKRAKKRAAPKDLPGRWLRSKSGRVYSYIVAVMGHGEQLYRLQSLVNDFVDTNGVVRHLTTSSKLWTEEQLRETGRFLKNAPTKAMIEKARKL